MVHFPSLIEKIILGNSLLEEESFLVMKEIISGHIPPVQVASFLTALRAKGESVEEIVGFLKAIQESMLTISSFSPVVVDTCGTGGDGKGTFNISTASAFVISGAGIPVAKHGNRSVSSLCGSADLLECAGVKVDLSKEVAERCLNEIGITFLFAPHYHPAMKNVAPIRKELGIRTVFNLLGPLMNPAHANVQVIGVAKKELVPLIARVIQKLSLSSPERKYAAMVIHESGYDELILSGKAIVAEVQNHRIRMGSLTAKDFGMKKIDRNILNGGDAKKNAETLREILLGKGSPLEEVVIANAALGIVCAKGVGSKGKDLSLKESVKRARNSISSGAALKKLDELIEWSHKV